MKLMKRKKNKYFLKFKKKSFIEKSKQNYLSRSKVKIIYILFLSSVLIVILALYDINNKLEEQMKKELDKIQPNDTALNWDNVKNDFELLANKYKYLIKYEKNIAEDSPIWVMWYQGIENAPPIVKACIQSIIINRAKHPVYIISKYNLEKYIKLPSYIIEKLNNKTLTFTYFSDITRMGLLFKYGGYWIDSTYFVNTPLTKVNTTFFTIKTLFKDCFTQTHPFVKCYFSINFMAFPKNSFIATYGYMAILYYWKKYNSLIEYFLLDYIFHIAFMNIPEFKELVDKNPALICNIFVLCPKLNSNYKKSEFECSFNKLSYKNKYLSLNNNGMTNYGYLMENYKLNLNNIDNKNIILNI